MAPLKHRGARPSVGAVMLLRCAQAHTGWQWALMATMRSLEGQAGPLKTPACAVYDGTTAAAQWLPQPTH